jgi:hypothetical protein
MRLFVFTIACCLLSFCIFACSKPENPDVALKRHSAVVALIDSLSIPIPAEILGEDFDGGAVEGETSIKISGSNTVFPKGVSASFIGTRSKPVAVILYSVADVETYYVPFAGVLDVDRPRRLTKLADRVYRIESNRSSLGTRIEKRLP